MYNMLSSRYLPKLDKILWILFFVLLVLSISSLYYKIVILEDYEVYLDSSVLGEHNG